MLDLAGGLAFPALATAIKLGLFEAIGTHSLTADEAAQRISADSRATGLLLDVLEALGYVEKKDHHYANTKMTIKWILASSPNSLACMISGMEGALDRWRYLADTIRVGSPPMLAWEWLDQHPGSYDADYLKETGGDAVAMNDNPVGTGPYIVLEWVRGDHITFVPNPNYHGEAPANTTFILRWNKEGAARLLDLQAGNASGIAEVTVDDIPTIEADPNLKLYPRKINNFIYLGINNTKPPFDNEKVRQAFAMLINKQQIVDDFYAPGSVAATQFVPAGVKPGFTDGYVDTTYDLAKGVEILKAEGFDFEKEYTLSYAERTRPYFPQPTKIAQAVQAQLAEAGIKVKLEMEEWATYLPATRAGEKELFFLGWSEDFPDATNWYDVFLTGSSAAFGNPFPDIVDLIKKGATSGDPVARQGYYDEVNKLYAQHVPTIVIAHGTVNLAFQASVEGVVIGPYDENFNLMKTADGTVVFSQDGEPVSLFCGDETDGNSFRACGLIFSSLYNFSTTSIPEPDLAEECTGNADASEWTCTLRQDVVFSNGATFDANDVVATFSAGMDYNYPLRKGNTGTYQYFKDFFGPKVMNQPAE